MWQTFSDNIIFILQFVATSDLSFSYSQYVQTDVYNNFLLLTSIMTQYNPVAFYWACSDDTVHLIQYDMYTLLQSRIPVDTEHILQ